MSIDRWSIGAATKVQEEKRPYGWWVKYEDHKAEIDRLRAELAEAKEMITQLIDRELQLRAKVAVLEEVVEAAREVHDPNSRRHRRLRAALAKLDTRTNGGEE